MKNNQPPKLFLYGHRYLLKYFSIFQTQNSVYEIVSDVNSRQDIIEERLTCLEDKLNNIQLSLELLPDMLTR